MFYLYGSHSINQNKKILNSAVDKFNIKVISPNFKLQYGLENKEIEERLNKLIRYSDPINDQKTLYVWPEGVFSGYNYEEIFIFKNIFQNNFKENHFILLGINKPDKKKSGVYNSMIIVNKNLEIIQEYKKQKLVPFGEFLPFEKFYIN